MFLIKYVLTFWGASLPCLNFIKNLCCIVKKVSGWNVNMVFVKYFIWTIWTIDTIQSLRNWLFSHFSSQTGHFGSLILMISVFYNIVWSIRSPLHINLQIFLSSFFIRNMPCIPTSLWAGICIFNFLTQQCSSLNLKCYYNPDSQEQNLPLFFSEVFRKLIFHQYFLWE